MKNEKSVNATKNAKEVADEWQHTGIAKMAKPGY